MAGPTAQRVGTCGATTASLCPLRPFRTGSRLGGKKAQARMDTDFLDWALVDFSGYVAADELYDGPFCILSAVDNRCYKRILYDVLDHDPTHEDIRAFLGRLKTALEARDLTLVGITTDGSQLYPEPLAEVFGGVPHQICQFHVLKELTKGVLKGVAKERERMEQVYALFDRRCRTQTALDKLTKLRRRLNRFKHLGETLKKLFAPTLEKALTFLDDTLLPSTSNAVERGNRRYRKMQKSI